MFSILLFGLIAGATAAPQYFHRHHGPPPPQYPRFSDNGLTAPYFNEDVFDTQRFWSNLNKELKELDDMLADFSKRFPVIGNTAQGVVGNEYKITIPLSEFEEKDIVVKVREGLLMIQATHSYAGGNQRTYLDARTIPNTINVTGTWTFDKGVLSIVFPLKNTTEVTEVVTTVQPSFESREEVESETEGAVEDVDVGLNRGDKDKEREVETNEIPDRQATVEATTYAVDLKDEYEFVPVRSRH